MVQRKQREMNHYKDWRFEPIESGSYGYLGKLHHKSYKAWINVFIGCFYVNGDDAGMIPVNK